MSGFLGRLEELKKFEKVAEIIIPDMVIREMEERYKRDFEDQKKGFLGGLLNNVLNHDIEAVDIAQKIKDLKEAIELPYEVIYLRDHQVLEEMKEMALRKILPFKENTKQDTGFKDAYIYFTVKEYLETLSGERVFFVTNDKEFKKAFDNIAGVVAIEDFDEFKKHSIVQFKNDYFLQKLSDELGVPVTEDKIIDFWNNVNDNSVILIDLGEGDGQFVVETDAGEVVSSLPVATYKPLVEGMVKSPNWGNTHTMAGSLTEHVSFLSDDDIVSLFTALCDNDQVTGAYGYGVKRFYNTLYDYRKDALPADLKERVDQIINPEPED